MRGARVTNPDRDSLVGLRFDLASARVLVWLASAGRDAELTPDAHLYFADRYRRLASCHRRRGKHPRASRLEARAEDHLRRGGWDGPPYAAAMAMPRPRRWFLTDAVSRSSVNTDDVA